MPKLPPADPYMPHAPTPAPAPRVPTRAEMIDAMHADFAATAQKPPAPEDPATDEDNGNADG